ncbi:MAG: cell division topological specificity factor MinE [Proteobacteria bacterium]|nr:MAG: cell division topological specificity factor MinE [Pseudomonadota bacterium]
MLLAGLKDIFFRNGKQSKAMAKSRLHFVLVQDRTGLTPDEMANFKREMTSVIEKYFVIDEKGFDISYERSKESTVLMINSPVIVRRQDAIGHAVGAKHRQREKQKSESISTQAEAKEETPSVEPLIGNV